MDNAVKVHRKTRQRHQHHQSRNNSHRSSRNLVDTITTVQTLQQTQADETGSVSGLETTYSSYEQHPQLQLEHIQQQQQQQKQPTTKKMYERKQKEEYQERIDMPSTSSKTTQHTLLLVNGALPHDEQSTKMTTTPSQTPSPTPTQQDDTSIMIDDESLEAEETVVEVCANNVSQSEEPPLMDGSSAPSAKVGTGGGGGSSRNSSGDAMSLRETLQHLPTPAVTTHRTHHSRHSRTHSVSPHSPQSPLRYRTHEPGEGSNSGSSGSLQHQQQPPRTGGIHGFMERELKVSSPTSSALSVSNRKLQTLSDPAGSPAPRSLRSRGSLERSPRRKRSKSESRRRRERKLIAAGEMEVRQANETLMRYLKQCSEMNDASLSGELEIDKNFDERRVQRKTKSQRNKRGHIMNKLYTAGGLTSLLKELTDDIVPAEGEEIYNPFTPVVSPTEEDTPAHIDKMFMQTSSGYRQIEKCYYCYNHNYHHHHHHHQNRDNGRSIGGSANNIETAASNMTAGSGRLNGSLDMHSSESRCLLDGDCHRHKINTNIQLACMVQRFWLLISNICHGLLAGLALAHLLLIMSSHPLNWSHIINTMNEPNGAADTAETLTIMPTDDMMELFNNNNNEAIANNGQFSLLSDYANFAHIYLYTFYCLAIVCLVSVLDRMDICHWDFSNATEYISFRWLIISMIYIATIILTICSDSIDDKLNFQNSVNITLTQRELISNKILSVWSSLSVTRSIGAICGWIMIGLTPHEDMLYTHLLDLTKYQYPKQQP